MTGLSAFWSRLWKRERPSENLEADGEDNPEAHGECEPEALGEEKPESGGEEAQTRPKNLLIFHLESVSWQTVHSMPEAFPHLHALMAEARTYRGHFASATSTMMVLAALLHANDFEMDGKPRPVPPAGNNPSLFSLLKDNGYATAVLCATLFPERQILHTFRNSLPPVWKTNDFSALLEQFETCTLAEPFAVYVWSQIPHIEANLALAPYAESLDDLVAGACAVADNLLGALIETLRRKQLLDATTILVFGDHGDDYYTHGFKNGLLHAVEPYTAVVHTPLIIRDARLSAGVDTRLASTVDLAPTCLNLLEVPYQWPFAHSGHSLLGAETRSIAFSQNRTACQPDWHGFDVRKAFAAIDTSHVLMVSSLGLEMYNFRLDPANQANILHHCEMDERGHLTLSPLAASVHPHFQPVHHMWRSGSLQNSFLTLREALRRHVRAKNEYVRVQPGGFRGELLDMSAFDRINRVGRSTFFNGSEGVPGPRRAAEADGKRAANAGAAPATSRGSG